MHYVVAIYQIVFEIVVEGVKGLKNIAACLFFFLMYMYNYHYL